MYESKNGYWDDEITNEEVEEEVEEYARHIDTFIFPDKEKINSILIYYNRKLNGSFVKYLKTQCIEFFDMFTAYKNMKLEENELTNVFVYPDIKTFNACLGNTTTKIERDILMGLRPNTIQSAYIVSDDNGDIHVVLPRSRGSEIYDAYFTEIMALVLANYDKEFANNVLGAKKKVVEFIKKREIKKLQEEQKKAEEEERKKQEEEERLQKELEEEEERKRQEEEEQERLEEEERQREEEEEQARLQQELEEAEKEAERERLEQEMLDEAKLQKELEEAEAEAERLEILEAEESIEDIDLNEDMQTLEAKVKDSENMDSEKFAKFMQAFLLFRAAKFHKPQYMGVYAEYCKTHKLLTLGKINKANIQNWVDQCTLALQVEYTINLYGHKRFLKYCFAACDKNFESKDLYKTIFGEDKLRFENALKEYCKLATRSVVPTLKLAEEIKEGIEIAEKEVAVEEANREMKDTEIVIAEEPKPESTKSESWFADLTEDLPNEKLDTSKTDFENISIKPLNAKKINPIWMALFNLREDGAVIPESNEYGWFINPEQRTKII